MTNGKLDNFSLKLYQQTISSELYDELWLIEIIICDIDFDVARHSWLCLCLCVSVCVYTSMLPFNCISQSFQWILMECSFFFFHPIEISIDSNYITEMPEILTALNVDIKNVYEWNTKNKTKTKWHQRSVK